MADRADRELARAVYRIQTLLSGLSRSFPQLPDVAADGVFGEETLEAVMIFQRDFGLGVTGMVDVQTWDALHRVYRETQPCRDGVCLPVLEKEIELGGTGDAVRAAQSVLSRLYGVIYGVGEPERTGVLAGETARGLNAVAQSVGAGGGKLDRETWRVLSVLLRTAARIT